MSTHTRERLKSAGIFLLFFAFFLSLFTFISIQRSEALERTNLIVSYKTAPGEIKGQSIRTLSAPAIKGLSLYSAPSKRIFDGTMEIIPVTLASGADKEEVLRQLNSLPGVKYAEWDAPVRAFADPGTAQQYYLSAVGAEAAWAGLGNKGDPDFVVAVIDSGIQLDHPDLAGAVWVNPGEIPDNGIDDDGNGLIDDVNGWNYIADNKNVNDDNSHGTHVAGIIAARENGVGITGIIPSVSVLPVKALGANGEGSVSKVISGLDYVHTLKTRALNSVDIRAVNLSLGAHIYIESLKEAIDRLADASVVVFAAAGNDTLNIDYLSVFPANHEGRNLVAVGSLESSNEVSGFSNFGEAAVGVYAYGGNVYSTVPGGSWDYKSGTSMATPVALSCFLLGWSKDRTMTMDAALSRFYAGLVNTNQVPLGRAHGGNAVNAAPAARTIHRFKEHLALFSVPNGDPVNSIAPLTGTVYGHGLSGGVFTIDGDDMLSEDAVGPLAGVASSLRSEVYSTPGDIFRDVRVNGGKGLKRLLISASSSLLPAGDTAGLPAMRMPQRDGVCARNGNFLWFVVRDNPLNERVLGNRYLGRYDMANDSWVEYSIDLIHNNFLEDLSLLIINNGNIYLRSDFNYTKIVRFSMDTEEFTTLTVADMTPLTGSSFYASGGKVYFAGGRRNGALERAVGEFNPETGATTILYSLPAAVYSPAMAVRDGRMYVVGGRSPADAYTMASDRAYSIDLGTGEIRTSVVPFPASGGKLFFGVNSLYWLSGKLDSAEGSVLGDSYLAAKADFSVSGWLTNWKIHPHAIPWKVMSPELPLIITDPEGGVSADAVLHYLITPSPAGAWSAGTYPVPAGIVQPDPEPEPEPGPGPTPPTPPTPPSGGGGGGCAAGAISPFAALLALPLLGLGRKSRGGK